MKMLNPLRLTLLLSTTFLFGGASDAVAQTYDTENVFVVIIDGLRQQEATPANMPFMLGGIDPETAQPVPDPMIDEAVRNTNFFNGGRTITTPGHQTILTGVDNLGGNNSIYRTQLRTMTPTMFEYYRKASGTGAGKNWIVAGKQVNLEDLTFSLHPAYGYPYRAKFYKGTDDHPSDPEVLAETLDLMATKQPSLMMINLARVDGAGHTADFDLYVETIKKVDKMVYDLWKAIQADPNYADKTTVIITSDHGRHSDGISSGFKGHNGSSFGDRSIILLALGPDFISGDVNPLRTQIDIVPTVGALLGFDTPYADGSIMTELFASPPNVDPVGYPGRSQDVASDGDTTHLVWRRQYNDSSGLFYKNTSTGGQSWSKPRPLFESDGQNRYTDVAVGSDGSTVCVAATAFVPFELGGSSYTWSLVSRRSLDNGANWEDEVVVDTGKTILGTPEVRFSETGTLILVNAGSHVISYRGDCDASTAENEAIDDQRPKITSSYGSDKGVGVDHIVWSQIYSVKRKVSPIEKRWNVYYTRSVPNSEDWEKETRYTANKKGSDFVAHTDLAVDGNDLAHMVWARRSGTGSNWELMYQDADAANEPIVLSDPTHSAWKAEVAHVDMDDGSDRLAVVWENFDGDKTEIFARIRSMGVWSAPMMISANDMNDSTHPRIAISTNGLFVTWADNTAAGWRVRFKTLAL